MKKSTYGIIILATVAVTHVAAAESRLPSFLPAYYEPAFIFRGDFLNLISQGETNGVIQFVYSTADQNLAMSVEHIQGDKPKIDAVFRRFRVCVGIAH